MKWLFIFFILLETSLALAISPPEIEPDTLLADTKFMGTVVVVSASARFHPSRPDFVCAVAYQARVIRSVLGGTSEIRLHMLRDVREGNAFNFLEVGERYFVSAEDRKTHSFIQLSDALYQFPNYPDACYGDGNTLHINREFTGKVHSVRGQSFISSPGLVLIRGVNALPGAYWSNEEFDIVFGKKTLKQRLVEKLKYQGVMLEPFMHFVNKISSDNIQPLQP